MIKSTLVYVAYDKHYSLIADKLYENLKTNFKDNHNIEQFRMEEEKQLSEEEKIKRFGQFVQKQEGQEVLGIFITGQGILSNIIFNKLKGIRSCCVQQQFSAKMCRSHNLCNILVLQANILGQEIINSLANEFLYNNLDTINPNHQRRIDKIKSLEQVYSLLI